MCEQDPDVSRWGLHLLQGDLCTGADQNGAGNYDEDPTNAKFRENDSTVENDEILAHALQEEFSRVASAEASGPSCGDEQQLHASVVAQDWHGQSTTNLALGNMRVGEEREDQELPSSCSSPEEKFVEGDMCLIEITDSALDSEVGKRLNQMVPVPHVPRINGEIPSVDEAISDHQRLLDRLQLYDLVELKVRGDGNCQFRALSDQLYRTPEYHKFVRRQVVKQLKSCRKFYEGYVPMSYDDYLKKMSKSGEWGDHVTLQAAADWYGVRILILTSFKDTCYIEILPNVQKSDRVIFLSFWAEVHYNSIYPGGEMPTSVTKKKRWWHLW
ncbi:OTU domain-containing protein 5-A-like [Ananas comosus]|uniref:ubiquitinyl hydrolase 1 n=1 Tax=Ananas comosus TaxID=4615 RepID=A0A6P5EMH7_ANACO|nr:OTU domain-containing protein 5-A-like [Ananas comosus]XP_020084685.1 OTU domain-containing protein 5-A-like [Ananas comosus]